MHSNIMTTDLGEEKRCARCGEYWPADEEAQAEARGDELIALWAWLKRIEAMKVKVEVGE